MIHVVNIHCVARIAVVVALVLSIFSATALAASNGNMFGRQSQNEGMKAVPAPGSVTIDGDLRDWDWSGRIVAFADVSLRGQYSVEAAAMWDSEYLYLAAKWSDPTPMFSTVNPRLNPDLGWRSDAWQIRFKTDQTKHLTTYFFTEASEPCITVSTDPAGMSPQVLKHLGGQAFDGGVAMAYHKHADGKGFTQEIRLPWTFLYGQKPKVEAGLVFRMGNEFIWGDPSGAGWPAHRYADNMQPGATSREFYWQNTDAWGDVKLLNSGRIAARAYVAEDDRLQGTIPLRVDVPVDSRRFTLAIEDEHGRRTRNLGGDLIPEDYTINVTGDVRGVEIPWDGTDDEGRLVSPGVYRLIGLTHRGIGAEYEMCFYNPGTPGWSTADGTGAWGGDHTAPRRVAAAGDRVAMAWRDAEGGTGLIGIGPDGRKKWGERRGAIELAANRNYVYSILAHGNGPASLYRFKIVDGSYSPFTVGGEEAPFEWPVKDVVGAGGDERVAAIAANDAMVVMALQAHEKRESLEKPSEAVGPRVAVLDAETGRLMGLHASGKITGIALTPGNECWAILASKIVRIDLGSGATTPLPTPGLVEPIGLAVDPRGNILTFDAGPDQQVKALSPDGAMVYSCGRKGGRARHGAFDAQGLRNVTSVAADAKGQVWTVEEHDNPRRVSTWASDGQLIHDYIGNTGYSGTGAYLNPDEPNAAYIGSVRMQLDREKRTAVVTDILWAPDPQKGEAFPLWSRPHHFANPGFVTSSASGVARTYLYLNNATQGARWRAIYMKAGSHWQPVAAIAEYRALTLMLPGFELSAADARQLVFWNDQNGDGAVQPQECTVSDARVLPDVWEHSLDDSMTIWGEGLVRYAPVRFTANGAPIYLPPGAASEGGPWRRWSPRVPIGEERLLLAMGPGYPNPTPLTGIDLNTMEIRWSYPNAFPGVHGSHRAPMPRSGLLIGPLKVCGVAHVNDAVGRVFAMRGNLGQDFYMTTDGLYVGSIFRDVRLPGPALPSDEESLVGQPMTMFSNGSEPFNGWFGKQSDGTIRMVNGIPGQAAMMCRITGLDTIQRFAPKEIVLDRDILAKADAANAARTAKSSEPRVYLVTKVFASPIEDPQQWNGLAEVHVAREGAKDSATVKMAYDALNLYLRFEVVDTSPWRNLGKDHTRLFKTGDCVDIQMSTHTAQRHTEVQAGDQRIVMALFGGKPVAVLMRPLGSVPGGKSVTYRTNWSKTLDGVGIIDNAKVEVKGSMNGYKLVAALPLKAIGLEPGPGKAILGDVGFISSDDRGETNVARTYWSNKETNLISDEPLEAWLNPEHWGMLNFE
ncbi:MAG: sugar-binding protein [Phycisphaeraceae bacterium]